MKQLNYDSRTLIMQNVRMPTVKEPETYTVAQYHVLCSVIRQKHTSKKFFDFLLLELYDVSDWRSLNYTQMYELIYILNHWNYKREVSL